MKLDVTAILIAGIAATPPTLLSLAAYNAAGRTEVKVEEVRHATNSMKDALVRAALIEGAAVERLRADTEKRDRKAGAEASK